MRFDKDRIAFRNYADSGSAPRRTDAHRVYIRRVIEVARSKRAGHNARKVIPPGRRLGGNLLRAPRNEERRRE